MQNKGRKNCARDPGSNVLDISKLMVVSLSTDFALWIHKDKYVARHINIWGSEAHTVDSLIEAMEIIDKFKNQEDWILQKREEFGDYMWNNDDFRKDITKGT